MKKKELVEKLKLFIRSELSEEVPVNNVSGGQIAGTKEAGDDPPVRRKKRYVYGGRGSRKLFIDYLKKANG